MTSSIKSCSCDPSRRRGFTLVELLIAVAVIIMLGGVATAAIRSAMRKADAVKCASTLKSLGTATILYTQDHQGQFPRSFHSAGAHRQPGWAISIAPYLGISEVQIEDDWPDVFNSYYRSPVDRSTDPFVYSYALNVHFELHPDGDDYAGSPATWRRLSQISNPEAVILMGQPKPVRFGDHLMCHQWSGIQAAKNALNHTIHDGKANYLFLDGHVGMLRVEETFDPTRNINRWNPSLAR
jgi:prepilin-type processing-associated H-X9-DG protein/prepilin-type N-terminal cleavage/methylation domain-containing protein